MGFEEDQNKQSEDLWSVSRKSSGVESLSDIKATDEEAKQDLRKKAASNRKNARVPAAGTKAPASSSSKAVAFVLTIAVVTLMLSIVIPVVTNVIARNRRAKAVSEREWNYSQMYISALANMMPYPEGMTFDHVTAQNIVAPYGLTIYLSGDAETTKEDYTTCAVLIFRTMEDIGSVRIREQDTGRVYVFSPCPCLL